MVMGQPAGSTSVEYGRPYEDPPALAPNRKATYSGLVSGPITKIVLPEGLSKSKVRARHSSSFGAIR